MKGPQQILVGIFEAVSSNVVKGFIVIFFTTEFVLPQSKVA